jgi:hypothetical protein
VTSPESQSDSLINQRFPESATENGNWASFGHVRNTRTGEATLNPITGDWYTQPIVPESPVWIRRRQSLPVRERHQFPEQLRPSFKVKEPLINYCNAPAFR